MEILSTEVLTGIKGGWGAFCMILTLVVIIGLAVSVVGLFEWDAGMFLIGLPIMAIGVMLISILDDYQGYSYEQHKVLITDFNEVHGQGYEILEQEGEIYTVQKKGADSR